MARALSPNTLVTALSGAAVLWLLLPEDGSPAATIHHAFRREAWRESGWAGRLVLGAGFLLWAPATLIFTVLCARRCGARVRAQTGKGIAHQVVEQLALACTSAVPPPWYYVFEFHDDAKRARARQYLYRLETKRAIYQFLRDWLSSKETTNALSDKAEFEVRCNAHGLPAVPVLATAIAGKITRTDGSGDALPRANLFLKPQHGAGGRGASRWMYASDGKYHGDGGSVLTAVELSEHLKTLSRTEGFVVRAYVTNHPAMAELSPGALSTVRVLTCRNEHGEPEVTHAVLRMASNSMVVVDNFHAGGIAAKVDIATGKLGRATNMGLTDETAWHDTHPATGARILGRSVPLWEEVLEVARRAHAAFADQVAVGWDIAVLEDGPRLVEGNKSPDLDIIQRCYQEPVGNSRFGELLASHVERALEKKYGNAGRGASVARRAGPAHAADTGPASVMQRDSGAGGAKR